MAVSHGQNHRRTGGPVSSSVTHVVRHGVRVATPHVVKRVRVVAIFQRGTWPDVLVTAFVTRKHSCILPHGHP